MERVMGIEPTLAAWEAAVLPLNYTRLDQANRASEPATGSTPHKNPRHELGKLR